MDAPKVKEVLFGDLVWRLQVDQRALYAMEKATEGRSYFETVRKFVEDHNGRFENGGFFGRVEPTLIMLWGLTASHRQANARVHVLDESDKQEGSLVPGSFVALLPFNPEEMLHLQMAVFDLMCEAGWMAKKKRSDGSDLTPSPSTGEEDSSTPKPS